MKLTLAQKVDIDRAALRTLSNVSVVLPGKHVVLKVLVDTMYTKKGKKEGNELLSQIKIVSRHTCRWRTVSTSGKEVTESCKCGETRVRPPTKAELKALREMFFPKPENNVHRVWHDFSKKFLTHKKKADGQPNNLKWNWTGYELMCKVAKWAKKHPKEVFISRCDDDYHMGSDILYIMHCSQKGEWFGLTVIPISQNGDVPVRTFLYPPHLNQAIETLLKIRKVASKMKGWR